MSIVLNKNSLLLRHSGHYLSGSWQLSSVLICDELTVWRDTNVTSLLVAKLPQRVSYGDHRDVEIFNIMMVSVTHSICVSESGALI